MVSGGFMTIPEMLGQSGMLTVLGMGVVFGFLIILIMCMKLVEILVKVSGLDKEESISSVAPSAAPAGQNKTIIAAIAAAIKEKQTK
jgi:oxaloacetate decarboxylase gamma subunit